MANLKLRYLLVAVLIFLTALLVNTLQFDSSQNDDNNLEISRIIPKRLGNWWGFDVQLAEEVYNILETRAIIHRKYVSEDGSQVFLSIVHYHDTKVDFHAPEACLGGLGQSTTKTVKKLTVQLGNNKAYLEIAELMSRILDRQQLSYYFYKSGDFLGQNYIKLRLIIAKNRLLTGNSSGSLIRVSTNMTKSEEKARFLLNQFVSDLIPVLNKSL